MNFLIDTNIILRIVAPDHPMCAEALNSLSILTRRGEKLFLTPQNLMEFWRTCTRPSNKNGLGLSDIQALIELNRMESFFPLVPDTPQIYGEWRKLVITYKVRGVMVHDARLVACMIVHGLTHILTFNFSDFARYQEITAVAPSTL